MFQWKTVKNMFIDIFLLWVVIAFSLLLSDCICLRGFETTFLDFCLNLLHFVRIDAPIYFLEVATPKTPPRYSKTILFTDCSKMATCIKIKAIYWKGPWGPGLFFKSVLPSPWAKWCLPAAAQKIDSCTCSVARRTINTPFLVQSLATRVALYLSW